MAEKQPLALDGVEPLTEMDRRWKRQVEQLQLDALSVTRQSAERWAASISAILGTLGLAAALFGPDRFDDISSPWRELGMAAFFAGATLAVVAIWTAGLAAHATAQKLLLSTGSEMRRVSGQAVKAALKKLAWSRVCSGLAIVAVLFAALFAWWAPREEDSTVFVCALGAVSGRGSVEAGREVRCQVLKGDLRATIDRAGRP